MKDVDAQSLAQWEREHAELDWLTRTLEESVARGSRALARDATEELCRVLDSHFAIEEQTYFPMIERLSDGHGPAVQAALRGHVKIREHLGELDKRVAAGDLRSARSDLSALLQEFRDHERREARLIAALRGAERDLLSRV